MNKLIIGIKYLLRSSYFKVNSFIMSFYKYIRV